MLNKILNKRVSRKDFLKMIGSIAALSFLTNNVLAKAYLRGSSDKVDMDLLISGTSLSLVANENHGLGDACYIGSDGKAHLAKADAIANAKVSVICLGAVSSSSVGAYAERGLISNDSWSGWTVGGIIYLSTTGTTGNTLTQTAPSGANNVVQVLGVATASKTILFNPETTMVEHV